MTDHAPLRLQLPQEAMSPAPPPSENPFCPAGPGEWQDLVDAPCRGLETVFKGWRNLDHPEDRAELARDIAALANAGGGHVVFGFDEDRLLPLQTDPFTTHCPIDRLAALMAEWLDPAPDCELRLVRSALGERHPVIRVGGHGATPVCARRAGPGVEQGAVYIRRYAAQQSLATPPRPETARAACAADWAGLIRACVRQDRAVLLEQIDAALDGRRPCPAMREQLAPWHAAARAAFLALVPRHPDAERLRRCHYALSYVLAPQRGLLEHAQLPEFLRRCAFEAQGRFGPGPRMFDPPYRLAVRPRYVADPATGDADTDFLEAAWLRAYPPTPVVDLWRVSPRGFATLVRDYAEDRAESAPACGAAPSLSPAGLARDLAELLSHAAALARFFPGPARMVVRADWWGLAGRSVADADGPWVRRGLPAGSVLGDHRGVWLELPLAGFAHAWPGAVAHLMAPVLRALEPDLALGADWVRERAATWRRHSP